MKSFLEVIGALGMAASLARRVLVSQCEPSFICLTLVTLIS